MHICVDFPGGSVVKNLPANEGNAGDVSSILGLGRSPGVRNSNPLQYSCLENPMDREAWWAIVHGVESLRHNLVIKHHISLCSTPKPLQVNYT